MRRVPPILLTADRRRSRAAEAAVLAIGLAIARAVNPDRPLPFELCAFKVLTGIPCPACGLTRAVCHALRGDWAASLSYHPSGILVAAILLGSMIWSAAEASRGYVIYDRLRHRMSTTLFRLAAAVSIASWIVVR